MRAVLTRVKHASVSVDGKIIGQMLLQLPQDETTVLRVKQWLKDRNITYKEETLNVFGTNDQ